jgi:pimeloyl-ACP methyl ester carboxylesterase
VAQKNLHYNANEYAISYEVLHPKATKDFIVLHGWGSNKTLMKRAFSSVLPDFRHIYIDLPGFGNSSSHIALNSYDYAKIIELFLEQIGASKDVVLGHSFGGKIATLLQPRLLVLVSSAGIYLPKPLSIKMKIAVYKMLKIFGLQKFRGLFVADDAKQLPPHMYETFKTVVNEDFAKEFQKFPNKALLCWGKADTATPLDTAKMIASYIKDSRLIAYEGDHYFFLHVVQAIATEIEKDYIQLEKH